MATSITDEDWDELSPENFETAALLRAVDAVDELRGDLNDNEDGGLPQIRTNLRLMDRHCRTDARRKGCSYRPEGGHFGRTGKPVLAVSTG